MYVYMYIHTIHTCRAILAPLVDVRLVGHEDVRSPHVMRLAYTVCTHGAAERGIDVETPAISPPLRCQYLHFCTSKASTFVRGMQVYRPTLGTETLVPHRVVRVRAQAVTLTGYDATNRGM